MQGPMSSFNPCVLNLIKSNLVSISMQSRFDFIDKLADWIMGSTFLIKYRGSKIRTAIALFHIVWHIEA